MPRLIKPRALRAGATLGIAAPGGPVDPERLAAGEKLLRDAGFRTVRRDDLLARRDYLAGDDARRADELMGLVTNGDVDGIVCARGGYGCDRILSRLDAASFRAAAKPLVGYSDITALLLWQRRLAGLVGIHGPMLDRGAEVDPAAVDALARELRGERKVPVVLHGQGACPGTGAGRLTGGSLTLVAASLGTKWEIDTRGAILLLEDVDELPYRIDRMLQQLVGAGKLDGVAGVGLGAFQGCSDDRYPTRTAEVVFGEVLAPRGIPFVTGLPFGHVAGNHPWAIGVRATIDGAGGVVRILERGVGSAS